MNAFALTIHKVQGLSISQVTIALNQSIFSEGQAYVAMSRCRELSRMFITDLDFNAIKVDKEAIQEYNRLREKARFFEAVQSS